MVKKLLKNNSSTKKSFCKAGETVLPRGHLLGRINLVLILSIAITFHSSVCGFASTGPGGKGTIKGYVKDAESGEALPYANVILKGTKLGTTTNTDGYFVLPHVPVGTCTLVVHYMGYVSQVVKVNNKPGRSPALMIEMEPAVLEVEGVTIMADPRMLEAADGISQVRLSPRQLSSLPSIGEVDVFRIVQLLPGISGASEGESGLYVRGGTPDQNLVLFDGMTIYHVDHFFGFFSAFNADAIKDIQVFKGGFPAEYGGRISSVVNLTGKTGDQYRPRFGFGANLLSGHAIFETPVFDKGTFLIAGRRSYTDFIRSPLYDSIYGLMTGEESGGRVGGPVRGGGRAGGLQSAEFKPSFYFYDLNSKLTLNPSSKDIFTFSFYSGKDDLDKSQDYSGMSLKFGDSDEEATLETTDFTKWGNLGFSSKWLRQWHDRFYTDMLIAHSKYFSEYDRSRSLNVPYTPAQDSISNVRGFSFASQEDNTVKDMTYRLGANWHATQSHCLKFGAWISQFDSRYIATLNDTTEILNLKSEAWQYSFYMQDKLKIKAMELTLGLRGSYYNPTQKNYYEPRASLSYALTDRIKLKGAWGQYHQFVNRIANENVTEGSRDFWFLANDELKPSFSEHQILGMSYENDRYFFSVEAYRKNLENLTEFSRRYSGRAQYEDRFFIGSGEAKGLEFLAQKKRGALTGWVGYTLGKVEHQFPAFNNGEPFPADHDRRHEINLVTKYTMGVWNFAATWVYASGQAYTSPESQYYITLLDGESTSYIHVSDKNANRLPDYHRLDLSASRRFESEMWATEIGVSVFNAYNHKNVWYREYNLDTTPMTITDAVMLGFTPTVYVQFNLK